MQLRGSKQAAVAGGAVMAALALAACSSSSSSSTSTAPASSAASPPAAGGGASSSAAAVSGTINAAGSTFQTNFQQAAISGFKSVDPGVTVNYGGGGSGAGRTALYSNTVLFAGSDSPIPASEKSKVPAGKTVLYFPVQVGPIAIAYNLSGVTGLKLDAPTLAKIFSGKITTWNDPAIKALNSGLNLPSTPITLAVRSDSSGTTQNFSLYLQKAAGSAWTLGSASTITWPKTAHAAPPPDPRPTPGPPPLPHGRRAGCGLLPDHLPELGPGLRAAAQRQRRGAAQGLPRLPARPWPAAARP